MTESTREPQNQSQIDHYRASGPETMGPWTSHIWRSDPRHLGFMLARYKFCAKMLSGKREVLEVGCGDAFGTRLLLQEVERVHALDFEPLVLDDARARYQAAGIERVSFEVLDLVRDRPAGVYDAAYTLDVIEHIPPTDEPAFMAHLCGCLAPQAVLILGCPNLTSQVYASPASKAGHVNCKTGQTMRELLEPYFDNVFLFGMNDEVLHTGYPPMAQYLFGVGVGRRAR